MELKIVFVTPTVLLLMVNSVWSVKEITIYSDATQGYANSSKCLTQHEYDILMGSLIKQLANKIRLNQTTEVIETLSKISLDDGRYVQDIVTEALKQADLKLLFLLEFLNQTKLPEATLNGMSTVFNHLNNTKHSEAPNNRGSSEIEGVLNWLDLHLFARDFSARHGNDSAITTQITAFLNDLHEKAKSVVLNTSSNSLLRYDKFNRDEVKYGVEHIHFIIESYLRNESSTIETMIRTLELIYPSSERTICMSLITLYELLESSCSPNETFKLLPAFNILSKHWYHKCPSPVDKFKFKSDSIFQKIFFHLKNVYNERFLYVKESNRSTHKTVFNIKTVRKVKRSNAITIQWKFIAYDDYRSKRILLTLRNHEFMHNPLRAVPCLVNNTESIVDMHNGKYNTDGMMNDAWNIEVDNMGSGSFRLQNDLTKSYLAARMNGKRNEIILVGELNAVNYDSAHWTLKSINGDEDE